jgi:hypothetical protein
MVMFKTGQLVKVTSTVELLNLTGVVKMVETDGSAWVQPTNGNKDLTKVKHYKVRGACVLLDPSECEPV